MSAAEDADLVLVNGNIYTVNDKQPRAEAVAVDGDAVGALAALGARHGRIAEVDLGHALAAMAWTGANGGAHGRRRGMAAGRFAAWWALAALTGLDVVSDPRLRERHFGQWQGLRLTEIAERWPAEYASWRAGQPVAGLGVETIEDLAKRVSAALQDVADRVPGGTAVVAMHGAAARHGCAALLGWPDAVTRTLGALANCHWTELRFDAVRGWQLWAHNAS